MFGICFVMVPILQAFISLRKREQAALLQSCSCCRVAVSVLGLFLAVP